MRKFTKEISALLASVAVGSTAFAGAVGASSEQEQSVPQNRTTTTTTTALAEEAEAPTSPIGTVVYEAEDETETCCMTDPVGTMMAEDPAATTMDFQQTEMIGTMVSTEESRPTTMVVGTSIGEPVPETTELLPPTVGDPMPPDELIEPTTETLPPVDGGLMPPDETLPKEPPMMGIMAAPVFGDADGDGEFSVSDLVTFKKWLHGNSKNRIYNPQLVDFDGDGVLDSFDMALMKRILSERRWR